MVGRSDEQSTEAELSAAVMDYLARHPRAMDTAAGIAEWWLPPMEQRPGPEALRKALDGLVEQGALERVGNGEHTHYRLRMTDEKKELSDAENTGDR